MKQLCSMYTVNTSSPPPTVVVMKGARASHCLHRQDCFAYMRPDSNHRRARTSHSKRASILTACKAQAGSPTLEKPSQSQQTAQETDVVVIGSGIGGLCCAALLAKYGLKVISDHCQALATHLCCLQSFPDCCHFHTPCIVECGSTGAITLLVHALRLLCYCVHHCIAHPVHLHLHKQSLSFT